jgi:hypothetical protein
VKAFDKATGPSKLAVSLASVCVPDRALASEEALGKVWSKGLDFLLSTPELAVPLFIMLLCGTLLSFLFLQGNPKFEKNQSVTNSRFFHLAVGFMPGALVMLVYHAIFHRGILNTLAEFSAAALPSSLILAGVTACVLFWKAMRP